MTALQCTVRGCNLAVLLSPFLGCAFVGAEVWGWPRRCGRFRGGTARRGTGIPVPPPFISANSDFAMACCASAITFCTPKFDTAVWTVRVAARARTSGKEEADEENEDRVLHLEISVDVLFGRGVEKAMKWRVSSRCWSFILKNFSSRIDLLNYLE